jgi:hypothetical protein
LGKGQGKILKRDWVFYSPIDMRYAALFQEWEKLGHTPASPIIEYQIRTKFIDKRL